MRNDRLFLSLGSSRDKRKNALAKLAERLKLKSISALVALIADSADDNLEATAGAIDRLPAKKEGETPG